MHIRLGDLLLRLREEQTRTRKCRYSTHRLLFGQCEAVLIALAEELERQRAAQEPPRIILPS